MVPRRGKVCSYSHDSNLMRKGKEEEERRERNRQRHKAKVKKGG